MLLLKPGLCSRVILATCVLHNMCMRAKLPAPEPAEEDEMDGGDDDEQHYLAFAGRPEAADKAALVRRTRILHDFFG